MNEPAWQTRVPTAGKAALRFLAGLGTLSVLPEMAWGHAIVQRYELPVPLWYYLAGAGLVVALTFVLLATLRKEAVPAPP